MSDQVRSIELVIVKSELGAGTRGASLGVDAMKTAALTRNLNKTPFSLLESKEVEVQNDLLFTPLEFDGAKRISGIKEVLTNVSDAVSETLSEKKYPLVLAGDHSTAAGTISGIKKAYPNKRLGVIWIDAHADLHTPYTTPSGNMHGMPLAMVAGLDNLDCKSNTPNDLEKSDWEDIKNIGVAGSKINLEDLVFIGVRDTEEQEDFLISNNNIKNVTVSEVCSKGTSKIVEEVLDYLVDTDIIYVSFDVDSLDKAISEGTGTPVADGLSIVQAKELNCKLVKSDKVVSWEMVEVNPTLDDKNKMANIALDVLCDVHEALNSAKFKLTESAI